MGADLLWNLGYENYEGVIETPEEAAERLRESWNAKVEKANDY